MALITCRECGGKVSDKAAACIHCGAPVSNGFTQVQLNNIVLPKKTGFVAGVVKFAIVLAIVVFAVSYVTDKASDSNTSALVSSPAGTVQAARDQVTHSRPELPAEEAAFISVIAAAQNNSKNAENDMQRGGHKADREKKVCAVLQSAQVQNWLGTVSMVNANSDGKGVFGVEVAPGVTILTWNNALSDIGSNTLIEPGSALFNTASSLKKGQVVRFSGSFFRGSDGDCIQEQSMTLKGKLSSPEFTFRFTSVSTDLSVTRQAPPLRSQPLPSAPNSPLAPSVGAAKSRPAESAPSFSCSNARFLDEQTICRNNELAFMDRQMASYYTDALKISSNSNDLKQSGRRWLEQRRGCQDNIACIKKLYADRIDELSRIAER